jgi:hypothetical protein
MARLEALEEVIALVYRYPPGSKGFPKGHTWRDHAELSDGCLNMIQGTLESLGCQCHPPGPQPDVPPMMYNDWIRCAITKREKEITSLREQLSAAQQELSQLRSSASGYQAEADLP